MNDSHDARNHENEQKHVQKHVSETEVRTSAADTGAEPKANDGRGQALKGLFWYGLARLLLFFVLFIVLIVIMYLIGVQVPAAITAVFALIIAMPLSVFVFPKLRVQANESVAIWSENRKAHKEYIAQQIKDREAK